MLCLGSKIKYLDDYEQKISWLNKYKFSLLLSCEEHWNILFTTTIFLQTVQTLRDYPNCLSQINKLVTSNPKT